MGLATIVRPVFRVFMISSVFMFLLFLYESPLFFLDRTKTVNFLYVPTEEAVKNSGIYVISVLEVQLNENGKIFMKNESDLFQVLTIDNFNRYITKNNSIFEFLHIVKNQNVKMGENLKILIKGSNSEINDYLARDDIRGASSGLALVLSSLAKDHGWDNSHPIAVTGAIDKKGNVLRVGLVREKVITAAKDGHSHVIVPEVNLEEALKAKKEYNLPIVIAGVTSVEDAVRVIEKWK